MNPLLMLSYPQLIHRILTGYPQTYPQPRAIRPPPHRGSEVPGKAGDVDYPPFLRAPHFFLRLVTLHYETLQLTMKRYSDTLQVMSICRRCGLNHPGTEGCKQAARRIEREQGGGVPFVATLKFDHETRVVNGTFPDSGPIPKECPVCEARRLKDLARVKRFRARRQNGAIP
jgi:hypothetical protein